MFWQFSLRTDQSMLASYLAFQRSFMLILIQMNIYERKNIDTNTKRTDLRVLATLTNFGNHLHRLVFVCFHDLHTDWCDSCPDQFQPKTGLSHPLHHCRTLQGFKSSSYYCSSSSARF